MSNTTTTETTMTAALAGATLSACFGMAGSLSSNVLKVAVWLQANGLLDSGLSFASSLDAATKRFPACDELKVAKAEWAKDKDQTRKSAFRMAWKRALASLGLKAAGKAAPRLSPESVLKALRALDNSSFLSAKDKDDFLAVAKQALGNLAKHDGSYSTPKEPKASKTEEEKAA